MALTPSIKYSPTYETLHLNMPMKVPQSRHRVFRGMIFGTAKNIASAEEIL